MACRLLTSPGLRQDLPCLCVEGNRPLGLVGMMLWPEATLLLLVHVVVLDRGVREKGKGWHKKFCKCQPAVEGPPHPRLFSTLWFSLEEGWNCLDAGDKPERISPGCYLPQLNALRLCSVFKEQEQGCLSCQRPPPLNRVFPISCFPRASSSKRVNMLLVVVAAKVEIPSAISPPSLANLLFAPVVFLINTSEIFMKATSMK